MEWRPALLLQEQRDEKDFALVVLNQPLNDVETLRRLWGNASLRVAADGGANRLYQLCQRGEHELGGGKLVRALTLMQHDLDIIIGDLDSLTQTTRDYYEKVNPSIDIIVDEDQYSTDFTKAVRHIRAAANRGAADIVAMGGLGGRVDQGLSQIHHLYMFQTSSTYAEGRLFLVSGESLTFLLKTGTHRIHVREPKDGRKHTDYNQEVFDKYAGIIPVKEPSVITLKGFEWDVEDWPTEFGGQISTSNHVLPKSEVVEVTTSADVLFTIALKGRAEKG
ncbi:putative Thiamine pyrophosphokinase [Seiridium unicorne]|uniref:Thiamine pyrophosphokinase n=1 Tax=Seiridium unicorne TaxID=138068 RepID=A0ABR2VA56_9PEZI